MQNIYVGLSGGVDSAVSAALLKQAGHNVTGVFLKNWSGDDYGIQADCPWEEDQLVAQEVAEHLRIPFKSLNLEKEYREQVLSYFFAEFKAGRTPNPDVMCNTKIKFDKFMARALAEGADAIATGHYAQISRANGRHSLLKGVDPSKDQTYFLHGLNQSQLSRSLFPIGHLHKAEVRELAASLKLPNASRKDSQGICFIGEIDVQDFLRKHISTKQGQIIDVDSQAVVGTHDGVYFYTQGQRKGLHIGGSGLPYYVVGKDVNTNTLFVAKGNSNKALWQTEVVVESFHWIDESPSEGEQVEAVIRYQQNPQPAIVFPAKNLVVFKQDQRAVTPGQSVVLYSQDTCLGGGVIA